MKRVEWVGVAWAREQGKTKESWRPVCKRLHFRSAVSERVALQEFRRLFPRCRNHEVVEPTKPAAEPADRKKTATALQ